MNDTYNVLLLSTQHALLQQNISVSIEQLRSAAALSANLGVIFIVCYSILSLTNAFVFINIQASKRLKTKPIYLQIQFLAVIDGCACLLVSCADGILLLKNSALLSSSPPSAVELNKVCNWLGSAMFFLFFASVNCQTYIAVSRLHAVCSIRTWDAPSASRISAESSNSRGAKSASRKQANYMKTPEILTKMETWKGKPSMNDSPVNLCRWISYVIVFPCTAMIIALFWGGVSVVPTYGVCRPNYDWLLWLSIVFVFVPLFMMFISYAGIFAKLLILSRRNATNVALRAIARKRANMSLAMFACFVMFILCETPAPIVHLDKGMYWINGPDIYAVTAWFALNLCLNGYVYLFFNRTFRREAINLLRRLCYKHSRKASPRATTPVISVHTV